MPPIPRKPRVYTAPIAILPETVSHLPEQSIEDETKEYDYAIMVLGVTGVGKSTMCNFFFNEDIFETVLGMIPGTLQCNAQCHYIKGKNIMFIDSPGFADTVTENQERLQEMGKALLMARNGVHAFVVCLNGESRFTEADKGLIHELNSLEKSECQSIWDYTILGFTHGRNLGRSEQKRYEQIDTWKDDARCPPLFTEILAKVQNRYIIVESLMDDENYYKEKCKEFIGFIEQVYISNKKCYTHRLFAWARDKYEEAAKKTKAKDR